MYHCAGHDVSKVLLSFTTQKIPSLGLKMKRHNIFRNTKEEYLSVEISKNLAGEQYLENILSFDGFKNMTMKMCALSCGLS